MSTDISYILFESGNDAPWESDGIEFVPSDNYVIHRGTYEGTYCYKYGGIINPDETDAYHLLQWGMARRKQYSLCTAWRATGIELCGDVMVVRNIADTASARKRGYIISADSGYFAVNKYYLLANNMATPKGDTIHKELGLADIDFSAPDTPWAEDNIFFLSGSWTITKAASTGLYVVIRGGSRRNWRAADLLAANMARPIAERENYYLASFLADKATKAPFTLDSLRQPIIDEFCTEDSEIEFAPSFHIESLFDLVVCYDCLKANTVPDSKQDQIRIPHYTPEQIAAYDNYIAQLERLLLQCDTVKEQIWDAYNDCITQLNACTAAGIVQSADYNTWKQQHSWDTQDRFAVFYRRAVMDLPFWTRLLASVDNAAAKFEAAKTAIGNFSMGGLETKIVLQLSSLKERKPVVGRKVQVAKANEMLARCQQHDVIGMSNARLADLQARLRQEELALGALSNVRKEQEVLDKRRSSFDNLKRIVADLPAFRRPKKRRPLPKTLLLLHNGLRITLINDARATVDGRQWNMSGCYMVEIDDGGQNRQFITFEEALIYTGIVTRKVK